MAAAVSGCKPKDDGNNALALMQEVNSRNIISQDAKCRIWYQVDPAAFGSNGDGTFNSVTEALDYISDNNFNTRQDLNLSGLFLTRAALLDDSYGVVNYKTLDDTLGTEEDLKNLTAKAASLDLPVMVELNLASWSSKTPQFQILLDEIRALGEDQSLEDVNQDLLGMFYIEKDIQEENWVQIDNTPYYYAAEAGSDTPLINQSSEIWRSQVVDWIDWWLSLGISGFYLEDYNAFSPQDPQANVTFVNWVGEQIRTRNPDAYIVASYSWWTDEMTQAEISVADDSASGADGMIAKAVTGSISAVQLGEWLETISRQGTTNPPAVFFNQGDDSLDLLKSETRESQYKMALALLLMTSGQVFLKAGDELGLSASQSMMMPAAINTQVDEAGSSNESEEVAFNFGGLKEQLEDGDSIFNFVNQAVLLRDSYISASRGNMQISRELSTETMLVLDKYVDDSHVVLVFNLGNETQSLDLNRIQLRGLPPEIGGVLYTGDSAYSMNGDVLNVPPQSMVLLK